MTTQLFSQQLKEARRDALVAHYIETQIPEALRDNVKTADDLYEYLLLDTKISDKVKTTPLAEAISSLQLYIHRAMEGYDGPLADTAKQYLAKEQFLFNWDSYNSRYSMWAGKERLRFYAGNYVEPSLRLEKTQLFKNFENSLNQGKMKHDLASSSLGEYLMEYNELTALHYVSVCDKNDDANNLIMLAASDTKEGGFYWRNCTIDGESILWSEFKKITGIKENTDNIKKPVPFWYRGRAYFSFVTTEQVQSEDGTVLYESYLILNEIERPGVCYRKLHLEDTQTSCVTVCFNGELFVEIDTAHYKLIDNNTAISKEPSRDVWRFSNISVSPGDTPVIIHDAEIGYKSTSVTVKGEGVVTLSTGYGGLDGDFYATLDGEQHSVDFREPIVTFSNKATESSELYFHIDWTNGSEPACNITAHFELQDNPFFKGYITEDGKTYVNEAVTIELLPSSVGGEFFIAFENGLEQLYFYTLQEEWASRPEFFGPCGMYLWEIFFHIPFLVASRFQAEQNYGEAERWYKYIFNSAGYRDEDGNLLTDATGEARYWNSLPLQEDNTWDDTQPVSTDPDVIATADPMHYKLSIFLHTLDLLIARGDAAYRQLERDTLTEAKMYYIEAQQLLGHRPDIRITNSWPSPVPTLSDEAGGIATPTSVGFVDWLRGGDTRDAGDGDFLPPYNDVLLEYQDKLEVRLYNLRHNLSLDGQPLNLPLYATPVDPEELHRQQASGGDGTSGNGSMAAGTTQGWRYPLLAERARSATGLLTQFGNSLQAALERQDNEKMTLLLQNQQQVVLEQQSLLQQSNLTGLQHSLSAMQASRDGATLRQRHFSGLISQGYLAGESTALELRTSARKNNIASSSLYAAAGAANMAPNIFGLATGGVVWGAVIEGSARGAQIAGMAEEQSAAISEVTSGYQRRLEEWMLQRDMADNEIVQWDAQIDSLKEQITMAQKQIALAETERAHAQAVYDMQTSRFTGQALYNWLAGRLSALYYQLYDVTLPVCLQAKAALVQELGSGFSDTLFRTPVWDDLWQGLLAGEALSVELQKLDNVWTSQAARGLEARRTVSLAAQRGESSGTLSGVIAGVLSGATDTLTNGVLLRLSDSIFSAELDLSALALEDSYNMQTKSRFIKSVAVTLPTLLGPYQDIEATLTMGGETATLSHGMNDNGRFVTSFDDARFLPFEGADPTTGKLTLNIFNVVSGKGDTPTQYQTVENLSDIIIHIHYILRDKA